MVSPRLLLLLGLFITSSEAYRLNVPRVLLPYHPSVPVSFVLEVTHPTGGCFNWRSTRPDIVSVKSINTNANGCSDQAEIRSVAKPGSIGSSELSSVIFAEDKGSGTTLSCGVTVDEIATISIETTTKVLFVDAAPARMTVDAFNADGDRFSTLSEIALEWELSSTSSNGEKPLRIVPFEQSTYEAPIEIVKLEKNRKKGYVILIEGVGTGTAKLATKFSDPYLQKVKPHQVELAVVANLLLVPSQDIYMPVHSILPFQVLIVKQKGTEVVEMPSPSYQLQIDGNDVALLDKRTSSVRALVKGNTAVHLLSSHVDVRAKAGLRPPSTNIHVVSAESVQWHVSGDNWMLQTGKQYELNVELLDEHGNVMFIADNSKFETKIDESVFRVDFISKNGTWLLISPLKPAKTTVFTKFVSITDANGKEIAQSGRVVGEQKVSVVDPVRIVPPVVYLPYISEKKSTIELRASGGSGLFDWNVLDGHVAAIETATGKLTANALGNTLVKVTDKRNPMMNSEAEVHVMDVNGVAFGETTRETFVGSQLVLNVQLFGVSPKDGITQVPMSDCRNVHIRVEVAETSILRHVHGAESVIPTEGTGCGTITLNGVASGDTKVTIIYGSHRASLDVSVYEKLKIAQGDVAIGLGSDFPLQMSGGPRPWILDPSEFYRNGVDSSKLKISFQNEQVLFTCGAEETSENVKIRVGNAKSVSLPLPIYAEVSVVVCCSKPIKFEIFEEKTKPSKCPANMHTMLVNSQAKLHLRGNGVCGGVNTPLQSINGIEAKWSTSDSSIIKIEKHGIFADISSKSKEGAVSIVADISSIRGVRSFKRSETKYEVVVTEGLKIEPARLVLWNEAVSKGTFSINGGSGHFVVDDLPSSGAPVSLLMNGRRLIVTPRNHGQISLKISDACVFGQSVDAHVRIADIHALAIESPQYVEIGQEVEVEVVAQDENGNTFEKEHRPLADANLEASNGHASIKKIDGLRYLLRADSIGSVSLSATSKSSSGRVLTARPKTVQIFSPIFLQPKRLTLIPEAKFQLEVLGGPQPTPPLDFALNNSKIASIESNALITSKSLGFTSISGTVRVGDGYVTKDSVVLRVVSLSGITLSASSRRVETGGRVNVRLRGLVAGAVDEEPFAFGGAIYPFKVTWSVSDPAILQSTHPLGGDVVESSDNQFAIWFDALRSGSVTVKAVVELNSKAHKHFVDGNTVFTAETVVTVEKGLMLVNPEMDVNNIRMAPNSQLKLSTAWSQTAFSVPGEFNNRIVVSSDGILRSYGREGSAVVAVRKIDSPENETVLIPVSVARVYSIDVYPSIELRSAFENSPLLNLPVGAQIQLNIVPRDVRGRKLSASSTNINYRPHRFDLTDIIATNNNHTLTITMKADGDTVLRIGDSTNHHISTFIRLSASESILPRSAVKYSKDLVVSDLVCLKSKILAQDGAKWSSKSSSEGRVLWVDEEHGVGQLSRAGDTFIKLHAGKQTIHSKISIIEPHSLRFVSVSKPEFVTNDIHATFAFPITAATNNTSAAKTTSIYGDCSEEQLVSFSSVRAPFECHVHFVKRSKTLSAVNWLSAVPVFRKEIGYACEVSKFDADLIGSGISIPEEMEKEQFAVQVTAKWISDSAHNVQDAKTLVPFHFAFSVEEKELVFSNMEQSGSALSIWAPKYDIRHIVVKGCEGDIVSIEKQYSAGEKHSAKGNVFYTVKLNIKSAALFSDHARKCKVSVENTQTGQVVQIPVTIELLDETAKQVYNALESRGVIDVILLLSKKYSGIIPTLLWTCGLGIVILLAGVYVKMNMWDKSGSFGDNTMNNSIHQTSIASSLSSTANTSAVFRDSPIFRSTPIAGSPTLNVLSPRDRLRAGHVGSSGDGRLWSTEGNKRF